MNRSGDWKRKSTESFAPNAETIEKREQSKEIQSTDSKWSGLFSPRLSRVSIKKANETVEELRTQIRTSLEKLAKFKDTFSSPETTPSQENNASPTSRRRKHIKKSPFPHQMEPRDSLLEGVIDKYKSKDLIELLQVADLQGLVNLGFLILVSASAQLILHNYLNHGFLLDYTMLLCIASDTFPASFIWLIMTLFAFSSYYLQKSIVNNKITLSNGFLLHLLSLVCIYVIPVFFIVLLKLTPVVSGFLAMTICVLSMKMHSYYSTNAILRSEMAGTGEEESVYPKNIEFNNFLYFLFVPTLVYEAYYPRTEKIRWWYALKEFLQALGCLGMIYILLIQFVLPVLKDHPVLFAYDIMRLSIPSIIMWLVGFYSFFHCMLNALSEVLRYADRQFYLDWWNAVSLDIFWRKWNLLVHEWLHRHIYWESVRSGRSKKRAMVLTFLFSAFMHELIFMVALRVIRPWFFLGMFVQIPLIFMSKWLVTVLPASSARRWGNIFVWFSLFLGQPFLEILYIREWFVYNPDFFCVDKTSLF